MRPIRSWVISEKDDDTPRVKPENECSFMGETLYRALEAEPVLDLLERLLRERDQNCAVANDLAERIHREGDHAAYLRATDEIVSEDPEAEALLREHGRLK